MMSKIHQGAACPAFTCKNFNLSFIAAHLAAFGVASLLPLAAQANNPVELPVSVITGVAQQSPIMVVTDPKQPRQPVPASDAADYLKTIPGFAASRSGGVNSDPVFRGMFGSRIKMLTNGGEMIGACPGRMDSPSSYISPDNFDKLVVIKGPQSVQYGPMASAATVLFERGPEQFEEADYRLDASMLYGSRNRFDTNLDGAIGGKQGYLRFVGNRSKSDDYYAGNGDRVPSRFNKWNADVALGWTPTEDTLLELTYGQGDGESRYAARGMDGTQFARETAGLRFKQDNLGEVWKSFEAQIYYNYADHEMDNFRLRSFKPSGMMSMPMTSNVDRRTTGFRVSNTLAWDEFELVAGIDGQVSTHRARKGSGYNHNYRHAAWNKDAEMNQYGAFAELTWKMAEHDRVVSGLRVDRYSAKDFRESFTTGMGHMAVTVPNKTYKETYRKTLPSAFARYEHDLSSMPATTYIGLGHAERFPDYWELFSGGMEAFGNIKPEKTTQLDFGIQYKEGPIEAWASGYVGHVQDFIIFDYGKNNMGKWSRSQNSNVNARIFGGELGASYQFTSALKGDVSLAYAYGKNTSDGKALPQIPPLEARFSLNYARDNWSTGALWRVVNKQTRTDAGHGTLIGRDFSDSSGFGVVAVNAAYRFNSNWKVSTGIDNLFNKTYTEHLNLQGNDAFYGPALGTVYETGRTWWMRVDMSF